MRYGGKRRRYENPGFEWCSRLKEPRVPLDGDERRCSCVMVKFRGFNGEYRRRLLIWGNIGHNNLECGDKSGKMCGVRG